MRKNAFHEVIKYVRIKQIFYFVANMKKYKHFDVETWPINRILHEENFNVLIMQKFQVITSSRLFPFFGNGL